MQEQRRTFPVGRRNDELNTGTQGDEGAHSDEALDKPGEPDQESRKVLGHTVTFDQMIPEEMKAQIAENYRKIESTRGLILEAVNVLYRDCQVTNLRYFRRRVEDARTFEELRVAADMLLMMGMFASSK